MLYSLGLIIEFFGIKIFDMWKIGKKNLKEIYNTIKLIVLSINNNFKRIMDLEQRQVIGNMLSIIKYIKDQSLPSSEVG